MSDFKREERYIVVKISDFHPEQEQTIRDRLNIFGVPTRECVVVEHDWPIYEQVWDMVQRMVEGREQSELDPKMLNHFTCERVDNAGGTPGFTLFMTKMGASHTYQLYQNEAEALHFNLGKALGINPDANLARIAELEEREQALAAHVERLSELLKPLAGDNLAGAGEYVTKVVYALWDSPKTSLAHRDADTIASLTFPTMLRKMWSGGEVQQWLNEQALEKRRQAEGGA
ncbi:hypothetical protein [Vreelandella alkaliphila]|uniref:Uncharacterized protein n=1 Tax=Vreelandella alkaliphila TaxID=272774 RepID=A0AAJ2RX80_9GAMM|nr:hypothetical protein [Halomonas alkaliphila]MDX5979592.1 hypothetical protein [Halomonas alkaliphila]